MKTCVFITGTNAVGKSALAWELITRYGGVDRITNDVTYCVEGDICFAGAYGVTRYGGVDRITNDVTYCVEGDICFAGAYGVTRYGGVDRITNDKGSSCTSRLAEVVEEGLRYSDTIFCEGSFLHSFGLNLSNALFKAERQLVVNLYCDPRTIWQRLTARSNGKYGSGKRRFDLIIKKQKQTMLSARKWQSIGVPVLQINTAEVSIDEEVRMIQQALNMEER